jgi:hypothetical protein
MIITPKIFILAIAVGLFWLLALVSALFLVAGVVRGITDFFWIGLVGGALCIVIRIAYGRNQSRLRAWVQQR